MESLAVSVHLRKLKRRTKEKPGEIENEEKRNYGKRGKLR